MSEVRFRENSKPGVTFRAKAQKLDAGDSNEQSNAFVQCRHSLFKVQLRSRLVGYATGLILDVRTNVLHWLKT